jgi:hypothetical protein
MAARSPGLVEAKQPNYAYVEDAAVGGEFVHLVGRGPATNAQQNLHVSIMFLENVELYKAPVDIIAYIIPGVSRVIILC